MSETKEPYLAARKDIEHLLDLATSVPTDSVHMSNVYLQTAHVSGLLLLTDYLARLIDSIDNLSNTLPYLADLIDEAQEAPLPTSEDIEEPYRSAGT